MNAKHRMWTRFALTLALLLSIAACATGPESVPESPPPPPVGAIVLHIDGMACPFCAHGLTKNLGEVSGVKEATVHWSAGRADVIPEVPDYPRANDLEDAVNRSGFTLKQIEGLP